MSTSNTPARNAPRRAFPGVLMERLQAALPKPSRPRIRCLDERLLADLGLRAVPTGEDGYPCPPARQSAGRLPEFDYGYYAALQRR